MITPEQLAFFQHEGYLMIPQLLTAKQVSDYRKLYEDFLENRIDASRYRSDLGAHADDTKAEGIKERITQIMLPGKLKPELLEQALHQKSLIIAQALLGDDLALDFDMLIDKAPFSNTPTPWHQDCAYWIEMPDLRAVSCWVSLDRATIDNGCMWYVPGSHKLPMRPHHPAGKGGGALACEGHEEDAVPVELNPGDCVVHQGGTLHYSRGNTTATRRRAFITNFRPQKMIALEREQGYDHTGEREVRRK